MAKHYDTEFKNDAVQYYLNNKDHLKVTEMASNLGIGTSTITEMGEKIQRRWYG